MLPAINIPEDRAAIHPWIANLLDASVADVEAAIVERMSGRVSAEAKAYQNIVREFVPCRFEFHEKHAYILCLKRACCGTPSGDMADQMYVAQPISEESIASLVAYFDELIRPQIVEFLRKLAGCGEEVPSRICGQFEYCNHTLADIMTDFPENLNNWKDSRILYQSLSGDVVLVNKLGETAWFVVDPGEIHTLFPTVKSLVQHYADFRVSPDVFDSYASLEFLGRSPWN